MNPVRKKIEDKKWLMYFTGDTYDGKIDAIIVDDAGRAITVWMDEEPIINDHKYLLKYQDLGGHSDGITKTRAKYLMLVLEKKGKTALHFFPSEAISKGIMLEEWNTVTSKKMNGKFFEVPVEWLKKIRGAKKI